MLTENELIMCQGLTAYDAVRRLEKGSGVNRTADALKELFNAYAESLGQR